MVSIKFIAPVSRKIFQPERKSRINLAEQYHFAVRVDVSDTKNNHRVIKVVDYGILSIIVKSPDNIDLIAVNPRRWRSCLMCL
jgi:hypothetical protein